MTYIRVMPESLKLTITPSRSGPGIKIPAADSSRADVIRDELARLVHFGVLYPEVYRRARERGETNRSYAIATPEPWLLALAAILWEGILQGFAWETIKIAAQHALEILRANGLAPSPATPTRSSRSLKFRYTQYADGEDGIKKLYIALEAAYESRSEPERLIPTRPGEFEQLRDEYLRSLRREHKAEAKSKKVKRKKKA